MNEETPIFTIPLRGDRPPNLANLDTWDPLLNTHRFFQEPGMAREWYLSSYNVLSSPKIPYCMQFYMGNPTVG